MDGERECVCMRKRERGIEGKQKASSKEGEGVSDREMHADTHRHAQLTMRIPGSRLQAVLSGNCQDESAPEETLKSHNEKVGPAGASVPRCRICSTS